MSQIQKNKILVGVRLPVLIVEQLDHEVQSGREKGDNINRSSRLRQIIISYYQEEEATCY